MTTANTPSLTLEPAIRDDLADVGRRVQAAFAPAVEKETGQPSTEPIPSDRELAESFDAPDAEVLHLLENGERVGGAVVVPGREAGRRALELFFIDVGREGKGLGRRAWRAIEERYPDTRVWETFTPHFEVRNIHFYINVCGFHAVEFFHEGHPHPGPLEEPDAADRPGESFDGEDRGFRFEKVMLPLR